MMQKVVTCLAQWNSDHTAKTKEIDDEMANAAAMLLQKDPSELDAAIKSLKLVQLADEGTFFQFISGASRQIAWGHGRDTLLGSLWAGVYNSAPESSKHHLLDGIIGNNNFFTPLYCLPFFLSLARIPARVLADWLPRIRKRLGNDGSPGLWNGIGSLAQDRCLVALDIVTSWMGAHPDDDIISMAVPMLGRLRAVDPALTKGLDELLQGHQDENRRIVFHRSWIVHDRHAPLDVSNYRSKLEQMSAGTPIEVEEALNFVGRTIMAEHRCDESFKYGVQWIHQHAPAEADPNWTHWVIRLARECDDRVANLGLPLLQTIVPRLLPIRPENEGTWRELGELLDTSLASSRHDFESLLFSFAKVDRNGIANHFSDDTAFHQLKDRLRMNEPELLYYHALSSLDEPVRHLGMILFDVLHGSSLPVNEMASWSDDWVALLIFHLQQEPFYDGVITRFLLALLPRVEMASDALTKLFEDELIYQMKNLPGACLEPLKKFAMENDNPLVESAVQKAEEYFEKIRPCHGSAVNSIELRGFRRASRLQRQRQSKRLSEGMEKGNTLIGLFSKSYTLYGGKQWQTYSDGRLDEPTTMNEYSHSMEMPRFVTVDPDGCAQRIRHASRKVSNLIDRERQRRATSETHES